jgi:peptidoglycan-N-acetylglucosamine deacetylase
LLADARAMLPNVTFPGGRRGAVSLTYDDGLPEHLDRAIPDLDAAGLRATFFIPTGPRAPTLHTRTEQWRAAFARGHELGNHTVHHPCSGRHAWVKPNFSLEAYSHERIESELLEASRAIDDLLGSVAPRTYAYTCHEDFVGPDRASYRPIVARLFPAARGGNGSTERPLIDPMDCDFAYLPSWTIGPTVRADQITTHLDDAVERGRWVVLTFHGVGGGHDLNLSRDAHRAVIRHIALRADELHSDTFLNVALSLRHATRRPWP